MTDLTKRMAGYAVPLPAINQSFNDFVTRVTAQRNMGHSPQDLDFFAAHLNPLFTYAHGLYSADFARRSMTRPGMISQRKRGSTTLFMDSGGYGFISGQIPVHDIVDLRREALVAQEKFADAACVVDVPTACIGKAIRGAETFDKCLGLTEDSLDYVVNRRDPTLSLRMLNMLQGVTPGDVRRWYDAVQSAPLDGFGFAGAQRKNIALVLELVVKMIRDGRIGSRSWFHVFGTNHPGVAVLLTAIQRRLRNLYGDEVRISFDSSTSFRYTQANGLIVRGLAADRKSIGLANYQVAQLGQGIDGNGPWPFDSPIGTGKRIADFLSMTVASGAARIKSADATGQMMLSHHSLFIELSALVEANALFDMEHGDDWKNRPKLGLPYLLHAGVDRIDETFDRVQAGDIKAAISHAAAGSALKAFSGAADDGDEER